MRSLTLVLLVLALAIPSRASYTVVTAKHTYIVDVRNQNFRDIWGAWVSVYETGPNSANIQVRADGYRDAHGYVSINPSQHQVYVQVRMEDPSVRVDVVDRAGNRISGVWVDQSQFGADPSEYLLRIRLPQAGFTKFDRNDVKVDFMFPNWINVYGAANNRQVELRLPRRSFGGGFMVNVRVRIPTDAELGQAAREAVRARNFQELESRIGR
jgi:hypothetical protein